MNPYEKCPVYENKNYYLRLVEITDAPDLLKVYSDERAVPFFNSDNCNGDDFHYTSLERMQRAIEFWLRSYKDKGFVRFSIIDKRICHIIGTIELFNRRSKDYFNNCGLLRLDIRNDYEHTEHIFEILSLILPPAFQLFDCEMIATKIPPFASERKKAAKQFGFTLSKENLIGEEGRIIYTDYYVYFK